ncbi:MAG: family 16 glycosylhydrolase [Ferruginibacter sp.]
MKKAFNLSIPVILLAILYLSASCKKSGPDPAPATELPVLTCPDITINRTISNAVMRFYVNLSKAGTSEASAKYSLMAGTALSPRDFTTATGTVTISSGQSFGFIDVPITGDSLRQPDLELTIQFSNPKNCTLGTSSSKGTIVTMDGTYFPVVDAGYSTPKSYTGYNLTWSDEFTGAPINLNNWNFETGGNGWGNHELEYYTNSSKNAFITNGGYLVMEARKETIGTSNYSSARMQTLGKREFQFGRIDIRAILPKGKGVWPALWLLGTNISTTAWPACGEIDMMESLGHEPNKTYGTMHWGIAGGGSTHTGGNYTLPVEDFSQKFHVFSIIWTADKIEWYVDDQKYFTGNKSDVTGNYPFDKSFFLIFNIAVGGDWPGNPDATTTLPQRMIVDYVRVFQ